MKRRNDPLFEAYLYETRQLVEKAELTLINCEKMKHMDQECINETFRVMHTIKGSSAMMEYNSMADTAHSVEDLFYFIRESSPELDFSRVSDIVLNVLDYMKSVLVCIENGDELPQVDGDIIQSIYTYLEELKGEPVNKGRTPESQENSPISLDMEGGNAQTEKKQDANKVIWAQFDDGCEMESVRAYGLTKQLEKMVCVLETRPENLQDFDRATDFIRKNGVEIYIHTELESAEIEKFIRDETVYLKDCRVDNLMQKPVPSASLKAANSKKPEDLPKVQNKPSTHQNYISVNVNKLDKLMDVVGELVISELMVIQNPEITGLKLNTFDKAASQLKKMTDELQDIVMSIRMVPIGATFLSMQRIVRDMCKKLGKEVELVISGEETEVDKNIIESLSDPLVHMIRNSIDHGIEDPQTRAKRGKPVSGKISLKARNEGGDVWITVADDGGGLNRDAILKKAKENGLITNDEKEFTDAEVWKLILAPGFSTKQDVSQFSGRGVGMDVVTQNIEKAGGRLYIDSQAGVGTVFSIRFPLTLAIIDGMEISVGNSHYTIPITTIREAIKPLKSNIISDINGHEAIMLRGNCIEVLRLYKEFSIDTNITEPEEGILVIVQNDTNTYALLADKLLGEHQVVVKPMPDYMGKITGVSGCSILGDGQISLILDIAGLLERNGRAKRGAWE